MDLVRTGQRRVVVLVFGKLGYEPDHAGTKNLSMLHEIT